MILVQNAFLVQGHRKPRFREHVLSEGGRIDLRQRRRSSLSGIMRGPRPYYPPTAAFMIIEPVDSADAGRLFVGAPSVRLYRLRHVNMLAAEDRVNIYDTRCKED